MSPEGHRGEAAATEAAWREFHPRLRSFVGRRVRQAADAEDIVQQVFLRTHLGLRTLRRREALGPWLYQTARNAIADHYRTPAWRREETAGDTREIDGRLAPSVDVFTRQEGGCAAQCVRPLVGRLSEPYRRAIERVELEGWTRQQAARREGLSVSGMKTRVQRARERLKAMLLERCHIHLDARGGVDDCQAKGKE